MKQILIAAVATLGLAGVAAAQQAPVPFNENAAQVSQPATSQRQAVNPSATVYGSAYDGGIDYSRTNSISPDEHAFPARPGFQDR